MVIGTFGSFLTESVEIVPAEFPDDVLKFAAFPLKAKSHIEIGTTLIHVAKGAVLSPFALLPHKIRTNF